METICALVAIRSINQQLLTRAENNTTTANQGEKIKHGDC
jgi:hypothetical protein